MKRRHLPWVLAALLPLSARADLADALASEIARNPLLRDLAARDPAAARALAGEAARLLAAPPADARSLSDPDPAEAQALRDNPLIGALYRHDPAAALDLLTRVKQAGGQRR
jgi:hypothetical protein